jgi:GNAT superfamily N-acetyltransferase
MAIGLRWASSIRKVTDEDFFAIREHLMRLDREILYSRFGYIVTEDFLIQYVEHACDLEAIIFGCWVDGKVRGIGELRLSKSGKNHEPEAAFTVERSFSDRGIGTALMAAIATQAVEIGVLEIFMYFEVRNRRMRRIAEKFQGSMSFNGNDCIVRVSSIKAESVSRNRGLEAPGSELGDCPSQYEAGFKSACSFCFGHR